MHDMIFLKAAWKLFDWNGTVMFLLLICGLACFIMPGFSKCFSREKITGKTRLVGLSLALLTLSYFALNPFLPPETYEKHLDLRVDVFIINSVVLALLTTVALIIRFYPRISSIYLKFGASLAALYVSGIYVVSAASLLVAMLAIQFLNFHIKQAAWNYIFNSPHH
jgi:hypothetical protein